jgi:hypothetical protein
MESKKESRVVLLYCSEWDSAEWARKYFDAYRELLARKWKNMTVSAESADSVTGTGDDGRFELRLKGTIVTSVEGLNPGLTHSPAPGLNAELK